MLYHYAEAAGALTLITTGNHGEYYWTVRSRISDCHSSSLCTGVYLAAGALSIKILKVTSLLLQSLLQQSMPSMSLYTAIGDFDWMLLILLPAITQRCVILASTLRLSPRN